MPVEASFPKPSSSGVLKTKADLLIRHTWPLGTYNNDGFGSQWYDWFNTSSLFQVVAGPVAPHMNLLAVNVPHN